jgi:DNA-directed RNA polymerase specialized sigma24 family protein
MAQPQQIEDERSKSYATRHDFAGIFHKQMTRLYLLSLLLTADTRIAEECFVTGISSCATNNTVFREWADAWARRAIIQAAIRAVVPFSNCQDECPAATCWNLNGSVLTEVANDARLIRILELRPFERFVFVMAVLEHHSDQECALLLGCSRRDVIQARSASSEYLASPILASQTEPESPLIAALTA